MRLSVHRPAFPTVRQIVTGAMVLSLGPSLMIGAAALSGIGHRWVDILAQFTGPAMAVCVAILIVTLIARLWVAAGVGAVVGLVLLAAGTPQWFPSKGQPEAGAPVVRLYTANLWVWNRDAGAIRASVADSAADVVVLIETPVPMLDDLDRLLPSQPYRVVETGGAYAVDGTVIASRWPVRKVEARGGMNHVAAVVETPLGPVTVFAVHLTRPWPYQFQWGQISQVMALEASMQGLEGQVVMAGDFNSVSSARIGRQIRGEMGLIPAPGWPGTWPEALPSPLGITIDQVYRSPDLALVGRELGPPTGSDHRPVVTLLTRSERR